MGDNSFNLFLEKNSLMVFHVFLISCFGLVNVVLKSMFLAAWILLFNMALYETTVQFQEIFNSCG